MFKEMKGTVPVQGRVHGGLSQSKAPPCAPELGESDEYPA